MHQMRLNKAFDYSPVSNYGIFYYLQNLPVPWQDLNIATPLDYFYHLNHSGNKIVSPLIDSFISDNEISTENKAEIANIIYTLFGQTWGRMWDIYNAEYNPLNNYDMTEHFEEDESIERDADETRTDNLSSLRTDNLTHTRTDNLTHTRTDNTTETRTPDLTTTETQDTETERATGVDETFSPETSKTVERSVYGFNSDEASPSELNTETDGGQSVKNTDTDETINNTGTVTTEETGTDTKRNTGTVTNVDTGTEQNADTGTQRTDNTGTQRKENTGTDTRTNEHTLTRFGNIGVTTTQQMLQSDIDLWQWNFFKNVVIPNIDGVLTISLY